MSSKFNSVITYFP